ncbi:alpha/beta fold hydrolase [Nocardia sp. XZ_19_385]|uniref:alpha/beta fold hydrolase n=1 Tax=Nocardia sp. XZ_19_385 TaxID=2769488 RepID=UPI00188FA0C8|nr:alpha/beta hydrolase [Nocardia sp. XZ_19_385]
MKWLLIRGLTRDARHWGDFPEKFAAAMNTEVHTIDPPGFGSQHHRTSPARIAAITDDIRARFGELRGAEKWSIMGISLGGMVTLDWIARYPGEFERAVVINSSAGNTATLWDRAQPAFLTRLFRSVARGELGDPDKFERTVLGISSNKPDAELDSLGKQWAQWQREAAPSRASKLNQLRAGITFRMTPTTTTPMLVITSTGDRLVSHKCSVAIATKTGAPLRVHPTSGHDLPTDEPQWLIDQVVDWERSDVRG